MRSKDRTAGLERKRGRAVQVGSVSHLHREFLRSPVYRIKPGGSSSGGRRIVVAKTRYRNTPAPRPHLTHQDIHPSTQCAYHSRRPRYFVRPNYLIYRARRYGSRLLLRTGHHFCSTPSRRALTFFAHASLNQTTSKPTPTFTRRFTLKVVTFFILHLTVFALLRCIFEGDIVAYRLTPCIHMSYVILCLPGNSCYRD